MPPPDSRDPPPLLQLLVPGGRFSPPAGKPLPPGLPPAAAGAPFADGSGTRSIAATIATTVATSTGAAGNSPPGAPPAALPDNVSPFIATAAHAGALPTRWTQTLLAGERGTRAVEPLSARPGDAFPTGDSLFAVAHGPRDTTPATSIALPTSPAQQPAFEQALGERLAWLVREGRHDARIKLHPAELGSIDIRLSLDGDSTRISLASPHAAVRDALELAVPRLRELLGSAGFDLSQVNVGTGDARSHGDFGRPTQASLREHEHFGRADDTAATAMTLAIRLPRGLVDLFA